MLILTVTCCKRQIWSTMLLRYRLKVSHYMGAWRCIMNHSCFPPHPTRLAHSTTLTRPVWNYLQSTLSHCVQSTVNSFRHSFLINAVLWWKSLAHILFTVLSLRIRLARTQAFLPNVYYVQCCKCQMLGWKSLSVRLVHVHILHLDHSLQNL